MRQAFGAVLAEHSPMRKPIDWWLAIWGLVFAVELGVAALLALISFSAPPPSAIAVGLTIVAVIAAVTTGLCVMAAWLAASFIAWIRERRG